MDPLICNMWYMHNMHCSHQLNEEKAKYDFTAKWKRQLKNLVLYSANAKYNIGATRESASKLSY